tara:strand:+ start:612 stop:1124 length:513 start_codon:yes stop_codon:yes gene_type:complete
MNQEKSKIYKKKAVFLDRDGVINKDLGYVSSIDRFYWVDGAIDSIAYLKKLNYLIIVISNQSGVSRGYYDNSDIDKLHEWINTDLFSKKKVFIDDFFYCTDLPGSTSSKRKPKPGMIIDAIEKYKINREKSFLVGDRETDLEAAKNANVKGYLFEGGNLFKKIEEILINF